MSKEAMKLALEVLKENHYYMIDAGLPNQLMLNKTLMAYKALEEALAKQKQGEPVAWAHKEGLESISDFDASIYANGGFDNAIPLYTTPQQRTWVGLTDEEKRHLFDREDYSGWLDYINAIEAKLKEKNT